MTTIYGLTTSDTLYLGYLSLFAVAALLCFVGILRVRRIENRDTRLGLAALLAISGAWSTAHVGYLAAPSEWLSHGFYFGGLVVGLAAVGPWLYFCSAYTGRTLHRDRRIRLAAVGVYLAIVSIKLTNPYHQLYYITESVSTPFPYLGITHQPLHWAVMGLAYALAAIGFFMLFELFYKTDYDVLPLAGLVALTGLPVGLDVAGTISPVVLELTYSPLGVAAFATGVLFVYFEQFRTLQVAGGGSDPVVILDDDDTIREVNESARELFPRLREGDVIGEQLRTVLPEIVDIAVEKRPVIDRQRAGETRYYQVTSNPFTAGQAEIGRVLTFTDVTEIETYRRELERQNDRLESFASMVSHDLRNPLTVAKGNLELAKDGDTTAFDAADAALDRMNDLIDDVLKLARQGQPIDETEAVDLRRIVEESWRMIDSADAALVVEETATIDADPDRLQQLFENLFRNCVEHGSTSSGTESDDAVEHGSTTRRTSSDDAAEHSDPGVTVRVGSLDAGGFYVEDDGPGIPESDREVVFGSGFTTNEDGTGFGLAIVAEIVEAHGWTVQAVEGRDGGARFEIRTSSTMARRPR